MFPSHDHKEKKWKGQIIEAGSLACSWTSLAEGTNLSVTSVRTSMAKLESAGEVTRRTTNKYQVVSLVKWEELQGEDDEDDKQISNQPDRPLTGNQQRLKNDKKEKKKNTSYSKKKFSPPSVPDVQSYMAERGLPDGVTKEQAEAFVNHQSGS